MAAFPTSVKTFTGKSANDIIAPADCDDLQDEVSAIETDLLLFAHDLKFTDATYDIGKSGATRPRDLFLSRDLTVGRNVVIAGTSTLSGILTSAVQPRCSAYAGAAQSLTDSTLTVLALNSEDYDTTTMHDPVTNNSRITVPTGGDGLYLITGTAHYVSNTTGYRIAELYKNGATRLQATFLGPCPGGQDTVIPVTSVVVLAAGDYIELRGWQSSGGALNSGSATRDFTNSLQLVRLW